MYGDERTRGVRHHVGRKILGHPVTEEEWAAVVREQGIKGAPRKFPTSGGRAFGTPNLLVRWDVAADPLEVAAFIAAAILSENPADVEGALRNVFGPTKEVI